VVRDDEVCRLSRPIEVPLSLELWISPASQETLTFAQFGRRKYNRGLFPCAVSRCSLVDSSNSIIVTLLPR